MLRLNSPAWTRLSHAYGDGADIPRLLDKLRTGGSQAGAVQQELMSALVHQGDVYTATYAAASHLVEYAAELGPCSQSDELLSLIGYASARPGPDVPGFLEETWEDAQSDARDLILERFTSKAVSEAHTLGLLAGMLDLSGEWKWAEHLRNWVQGYEIGTECLRCGRSERVAWQSEPTWLDSEDRSHRLSVLPHPRRGLVPSDDMEFEDEQIPVQLIGLAESTGYDSAVRCICHLFGHFACVSCGDPVPVTAKEPGPPD